MGLDIAELSESNSFCELYITSAGLHCNENGQKMKAQPGISWEIHSFIAHLSLWLFKW